MANEISNKSDILFLYENIKANPNGDPDENKPRIDPVTKHCLVTNVRKNRTVRDYLKTRKGLPIFVERREFGEAQTSGERLEEVAKELKIDLKDVNKEGNLEKLFDHCIDIRLFGATITIRSAKKRGKKESSPEGSEEAKKGSAITRPGPVQLIMGESLHRVEIETVPITAAFKSTEKVGQPTRGIQYKLPYALIAVSGIINPKSGERTRLRPSDIDLFLEGLWFGTLNLNTGSKNQYPKILLKVDYNNDKFNVGMLDRYLMGNLKRIDGVSKEEDIHSSKQFYLIIDDIVSALKKQTNQISKITIVDDGEIITKHKNQVKGFADALKEEGIDNSKVIKLTPEQLIVNEKEKKQRKKKGKSA